MWLIIFITSLLFTFPSPIDAEQNVVINEFSVDPEQKVELWNNATDPVDISNWYLDDSGGTTYFTIPSNTLLYANSCAVFSENINLNKASSDIIRLFDSTAPPTTASAHLVDSFAYPKSPGAATSWLRLPDGEDLWSTGSASFGLSNKLGTSCVNTPTPTLTLTPTPQPTITPIPTTILPTVTPPISGCIFLSEVMPYPLPNTEEWVEFYNSCSYAVELHNWWVDDLDNGGSTPKQFSLTIAAYGFTTIDLSSSILNNTGDTVRLIDHNNNLIDITEYINATEDQSLSRQTYRGTADIWCSTSPSKNVQNSTCNQPVPQLTPNIQILLPSPIFLPTATTITNPKLFTGDLPINLVINFIPTPTVKVLGVTTTHKTQLSLGIFTPLYLAYILTFLSSLTTVITSSLRIYDNYLH